MKLIYFQAFTGAPVAKGRPKFTRQGRAYTPAKTREYEEWGKALAKSQWRQLPYDGPVHAEIMVYLIPPKSWSRKKRAAAVSGEVLPVSRPDLDNYCKAALDILNEVVIKDDSCVISVLTAKRYSNSPRLSIKLYSIA